MKKKIKVVIGIVLIVAFAFCYAHIAKLNNIDIIMKEYNKAKEK